MEFVGPIWDLTNVYQDDKQLAEVFVAAATHMRPQLAVALVDLVPDDKSLLFPQLPIAARRAYFSLVRLSPQPGPLSVPFSVTDDESWRGICEYGPFSKQTELYRVESEHLSHDTSHDVPDLYCHDSGDTLLVRFTMDELDELCRGLIADGLSCNVTRLGSDG